MYRDAYIEINLDNYLHNLKRFQQNKKIMAVVKANAYGLGDYFVCEFLAKNQVDFFCVSSLEEALNLRKHHINNEILVLGYVKPKDFDIVRKENISLITISKEYVLNNDFKDLKVHLKIDTGMNRVGVKPIDAQEILNKLNKDQAKVLGIMSHFHSADSNLVSSKKQYDLFKKTVLALNYHFQYIHMAATDASLIIEDDICNYHRIGLGLLGYSTYDFDLKPVINLYAKIINVKKAVKDETISYGAKYKCKGDEYIYTLPIGYADGVNRLNTNKDVYIENEYAKIVGSICMDQMMVVSNKFHEVDTPVEIFGNHIDINLRAQELNTIVYELITSLSDRLTRVYTRNNEIISEICPRFL